MGVAPVQEINLDATTFHKLKVGDSVRLFLSNNPWERHPFSTALHVQVKVLEIFGNGDKYNYPGFRYEVEKFMGGPEKFGVGMRGVTLLNQLMDALDGPGCVKFVPNSH